MWSSHLSAHFAAFPSVAVDNQTAYVNPRPDLGANRWEVYPKYAYSAEVTAETAAAARTTQSNYVEDIRIRTRDLLATLQGTTVLSIHREGDEELVVTS